MDSLTNIKTNTEDKDFSLTQFRLLPKNDFYNSIVKLVLLLFFIILVPILVYQEFLSEKYSTVILLILAEFLFIFIAYFLFINIKENKREYKASGEKK